MTTIDPEQIVNEFIARVVALDIDGACELVADDVEYDNVPMGKVEGPDGIRAVLGPMVGGVDRAEWIVHRQVASGSLVMNERTDRFGVGDRWMEIAVAGVFEVGEDGLITLWRDYFDLQAMNDQLAALAAD